LLNSSLLLAILLLTTGTSSSSTLAAFLASLSRFLVLIIITIGVLAFLSTFLRFSVTIIIIAIFIFTVLIIIFNDFKIVLKSQGNKLVLELVSEVIILIHKLSYILFTGTFLIIIFFLLGRLLAFSKFFLIGHNSGLEEIEETLLFNNLSDSLTGFSLLCLLLLLDLLFCDILTVFPFDLSTFALLDHVLALHCETLGELLILEVIVLLKSEDQVEAIAGVMQFAFNIL